MKNMSITSVEKRNGTSGFGKQEGGMGTGPGINTLQQPSEDHRKKDGCALGKEEGLRSGKI